MGSAPARTLASAPSELRNPKGLWRGVLGFQRQSSRTRCLLRGLQGATRWGRGETSQVIIGPPGEGSRWTYFKAEPVGLPGGLEVEGRSKRGIKATAGTLSCATETGESAQGTGGHDLRSPCILNATCCSPDFLSGHRYCLPTRLAASRPVISPTPSAPRLSGLPARFATHSQ